MTVHPAILVVDDDEASRYVKARVLESQGFAVEQVCSGERALGAIEEKEPDLVLLDVKLPGIDGIEACRIIKKRWPTVFVLHTSAAYRKPADRTRGLDSGADGYLAEPVEPSELVANVRSLLRIRQVENELRLQVERNQMLLREVQHRTTNNLQLVVSFLNIEHRAISDPHAKERIKAAMQRVHALAAVHRHLYSRGSVDRINFGSYVEALAADIANATAQKLVVLRSYADPLWTDADRAVRLGLIVNELVTNAVKYAFSEGEGGQISLDMRVTGPNEAVLTIEDDGRGFAAGDAAPGSSRSGLGLAQALAEQSDAELIRDGTSRGTRWRVILHDPEARLAAEAAQNRDA
ncbi:MAG: response regulator [Alphaproteobacteria bacterium]|nr:response regulator [Alphaproteobacteria bacterium]